MQSELSGFRERRACVVAVGQGTTEEAAHYCGRAGAEFPCVGDAAREAYRALSLPRGGVWSVMLRSMITNPFLSFARIKNADLAASQLEASDVLQLGGVAIVARGGALRFLHVAAATDDIPSNADVFASLESLDAPAA